MTSQKQKHQFSHHTPVLLEAVIALIKPKVDESYLDLTAGYGGHAKAVIKHTRAPSAAVLIDRDPEAINYLRELFAAGESPDILHLDYEQGVHRLINDKRRFDMIIMDLGISSPQLEKGERGFSFFREGPLDMRMDPGQELTAHAIVNTYDLDRLEAILKNYGEEHQYKRLAKEIVQNRPFNTTTQLAELIERVLGRTRRGKAHAATKTFQALRIAVNDELGQLERTLPRAIELLNPGGRIIVITFHSLEDRLVKHYLLNESRNGYEATLELLTKKPLRGDTEDVFNIRSRSAKLRGAVKK